MLLNHLIPVGLTRLKKTKKSDIKRIQALQPIGILFND